MAFDIIFAQEADIPEIIEFIKGIALYEKLADQVTVTELQLKKALFGPRPFAEVIFLLEAGKKVAFAIFFHNFSSFSGKQGLYLEDLFVKPEFRGKGYGKALLKYLAKLAVDRDCGRFEWTVLDWNKPAIDFYLSMGSQAMDEWTVHRLSGKALLEAGRDLG